MKDILKTLEEILQGNPWQVRPKLKDLVEELKREEKKKDTLGI